MNHAKRRRSGYHIAIQVNWVLGTSSKSRTKCAINCPDPCRPSNNYLLAGVVTKTTRAQMGKDEDVQPSFKIEWTKKDSATYTVKGSYEDVFKFFEKRNANKEEWGKFSPTKPEVAFKPKDGPIQEVV